MARTARSSKSAMRRTMARGVSLLAGAMLVPALAAPPAQAGLLDSLTEPVDSLVDEVDDAVEPVTDPLVGTVEGVLDPLTGLVSLLGPTGWLYDDSQTSMSHVRSVIGAEAMWARGYTGQGVGIALIDTGVVPVKGLTSGNVVNGADLSFDSQYDELRYHDAFGHGTHMAGIIAGDEPATLLGGERFRGVAPDAELTSVKVGASDGAVDVSQVIAAVDWVVEHRNDDPKNPIRVLNLAYGTDGVQDYRVDPLTHAVENAWRAGIVVVVSGGNEGFAPGKLNNPAYHPRVLTVGAADTQGTTSTLDDTVPDFSSRGDSHRRVDLTAPGRSIVSLRDEGSYIDTAHPDARVGDRFFKGSGTSQAAAVVSGAVALLLEQRPHLTPDRVKALLRSTAARMPKADAAGKGAGEIDLATAGLATAPTSAAAAQAWPRSTGIGSLEQARGSGYVADDGVELTGERDIFGRWHAEKWAEASSVGAAWAGGKWNRRDWSGSCWCGSSWTVDTWSWAPWSGETWAGQSWVDEDWAGARWHGARWHGARWHGARWHGARWHGARWHGSGWN